MDTIDVYRFLAEGDEVRLTIARQYDNDTLEGEVSEIDGGGDVPDAVTVDLETVYRQGSTRCQQVTLKPDPGKPWPLKAMHKDVILGGVYSLSSGD